MYQKLVVLHFVKVIVDYQFYFNQLNGVEKIVGEKRGIIIITSIHSSVGD